MNPADIANITSRLTSKPYLTQEVVLLLAVLQHQLTGNVGRVWSWRACYAQPLHRKRYVFAVAHCADQHLLTRYPGDVQE
jgi:hypothetical protein